MTEIHLSVDILCDWLGYEPAYRVYVDGDLLTERTYCWDNQHQFVREHLILNIGPGSHTLIIDPVKSLASQAHFKTANLTINDNPVALIDNTFII